MEIDRQCNSLQHSATHCNALQRIATQWYIDRTTDMEIDRQVDRIKKSCSIMHCVAVRCSALQCVAVRCSELHCVAVCCSEPFIILFYEGPSMYSAHFCCFFGYCFFFVFSNVFFNLFFLVFIYFLFVFKYLPPRPFQEMCFYFLQTNSYVDKWIDR